MVRSVREFPDGAPPPAPYPEDDASDATLRDGTPVHLRAIRTDEAPKLLELYDRLSTESLYFRFFAVPDKNRSKAEYLAHVDYMTRYALVAEALGVLVGVARWESAGAGAGHAEVAFTVADDMQGKGLGTILFARLAALARARGITVFEAEVLKNNERMLRVFERTGLPTATRDQGKILTILMTLDPAGSPPV